MTARSFSTTATTPEGLARTFAAPRAEVPDASGGIVFVSGAFAADPSPVAQAVQASWRGVPTCVVPAHGLLTERGELEGITAAAGMLWTGGMVSSFAIPDADWPIALQNALNASAPASPSGSMPPPSVAPPSSRRTTTVVLFSRARLDAAVLARLSDAVKSVPFLTLLGAGSAGDSIALFGRAPMEHAGVAGLILRDVVPPLVGTSSACRLLGPLRTIDEVSNGMVLMLEGTRALDVLSQCAAATPNGNASDPPEGPPSGVVLTALSGPTPPQEGAELPVIIRPIRGVDPACGGVLVGPEAAPGMRMTFAVCDAAVSRTGIEAVGRTLAQHALGSAPRFALYVGSAARGTGLYGGADVETRILRQRFGDMPIAGMRSAFEILPGAGGGLALTEYSGVVSLFRSPS